MIYEALQILKEQLENYFVNIDFGTGNFVALENIALLETSHDNADNLKGKVVLTLLNLEEEATLKNLPHYRIVDGSTKYRNPAVHINIYLLISANCDTYAKSLRSISKVIQFFQGKNVFTSANTVYNRDENVAFDDLESFKFILELYTPSFEELNYVWGTLGGRQLPSVIYKIQLVSIDQGKTISESEVIHQLKGELGNKN